MELGARTAAWIAKSGTPLDFIDGYNYSTRGELVENTSLSVVATFVPVVLGHSLSIQGDGGNAITYKADRTFADYWGLRRYPDARTFTANGVFVRWNCATAHKNETYIFDNTDGVYLVKDGVLLLGGGLNA